MSHDFARSHRLKKESSSRKPARKKKSGVPSWLWVLVGTLAGCLIMFLVYLSGVAPRLPNLQAAKQVPATGEVVPEKKASEPAAPPKRVSPVFEFYTKLPESGGQPVTDIPAQAQPAPVQADAQPATATTDGAPAASTTNLDPIQQLLAEKEAAKTKPEVAMTDVTKTEVAKTPAPKTETPKESVPPKKSEVKVAATKPEPAKPAPAKADPVKTEQAKPAATKGRYLQAGAFRNKTEVERLRARITMLGLTPTVQASTNAKGETLQRVMVGPFTDAGKMKDAQILLGGNGVNTIPTR